ncbi:hypothetical protein GIB67_002528 [Kingdonia uniflora]|uniref:ribose-5-phosphate isomerase n=1 Tax=Kingdonia uniflora TaxID=39325 RepID=A0A7J7N8V2_9MAGN|nr:hypothetical protein GIB67_002528 [Kingdonia uniflora]
MEISFPPLIFSNGDSFAVLSKEMSLSSPPNVVLTQEDLKRLAAYKAVAFVESGMVIGLGTGSTTAFAVEQIGQLLQQGKLKNIVGISTSKKTQEQALALGIPLSDLNTYPVLDLAIDGADEVDSKFNLVKGRGGSLLREKMVEGACLKFVVIVDESKIVENLGASGLPMPVEIVPFLDLYFEKEIGDLNFASDSILRIAGVVEHGMFIDMATTVVIASVAGIILKHKLEGHVCFLVKGEKRCDLLETSHL